MNERLMVQVCIHRILSKNGEKFEVEFEYCFAGQMPQPVSKLSDTLQYEAARFARKSYGVRNCGMVYYDYKKRLYTSDWCIDGEMFYRALCESKSELETIFSAVVCARNNPDFHGKVKIIWTGDVGCVSTSFINNEDAILAE